MTDIVAIQEDLTMLLKSTATLDLVNVVQFRKLLLDSEQDAALIWQQPRNAGGPAGIGILIEMPAVKVTHPSLPGPEFIAEFSFVVLEERITNQTAAVGTQLTAEEVAQRVAEILHGATDDLWGGGMFADGPIIEDVASDVVPPGILGKRVKLNLRLRRQQTERAATPVPALQEDNTTAFTCATAGAAIYYTLDGSFPGKANANAVLYAAPFTPEVGQTLRAAAYADGLLPSHVIHGTISAPD
jgi:hypothetical protein